MLVSCNPFAYLSKCSDPNMHLQRDCVGSDALGDPRRWTASKYNGGYKMAHTHALARTRARKDSLSLSCSRFLSYT